MYRVFICFSNSPSKHEISPPAVSETSFDITDVPPNEKVFFKKFEVIQLHWFMRVPYMYVTLICNKPFQHDTCLKIMSVIISFILISSMLG